VTALSAVYDEVNAGLSGCAAIDRGLHRCRRLIERIGNTCEYVSSVIFALAWPSIFDTTVTGTPSSSSNVANVCRRSWNRTLGAAPS
jgi:hypothetical protein